MNKAIKLLDPVFVKEYFKDKILPLYPQFYDIKKISIKPHKKLLWDDAYHIVLEFETSFLEKKESGEIKTRKLPIFCSGHSHEERKNVFEALSYLWEKGFSKGYRTIPRPLYYSQDFQAVFYRGVSGKTLYHYIKLKDFNTIEDLSAKAAQWFVKLHQLDTSDAKNFNPENSRILTVLPGKDHVIETIAREYPNYLNLYQRAYNYFINEEESFLKNTDKYYLVHGDAHPENLIKMGRKKIAVIDFTDLCLGDFARDIGTFLQQVAYMSQRKINDKDYGIKLQKIFLDNYLENAKIKLDNNLKKRISVYYHWTALRTATFLLMGSYYRPERAKYLLDELDNELENLINLFK